MTVCVAAICQWNDVNPGHNVPMVTGAADRMLTAGDIQYEPQQRKILALGKTVNVLIAGDAAVHSWVLTSMFSDSQKPMTVLDAAEAYALRLSEYRKRQVEQIVLNPLGLTFDEFNSRQNDLAPQVVNQVIGDLRRFRLDAEAIIAGVDSGPEPPAAPHIYVVRGDGTVRCHDFVGFAAIGIGASHAESQFMSARYSRDWTFPAALFMAYSAKKKAEVAPGVGVDTDLFCADMANSFWISREIPKSIAVLAKLDKAYTAAAKKVDAVRKSAESEVVTYVRETFEKARKEGQSIAAPQESAGPSGLSS